MSQIADALNLICQGRLTEIRLFERNRTYFGYFTDYAAAEREIRKYQQAKAVYFIPNEIDPALLARNANKITQASRGDTTGDQHVVRRHWLLIDLDPMRVAGVSSTNEEKDYAYRICRAMYSELRERGFHDPIVADSSNGYHLLYKIDEPPDDSGLHERCLKALHQRYSDAHVEVDLKCFNPARIFKLYGTISRKGDNTEDRPHRNARVMYQPEDVLVNSTTVLQELADEYQEPQTTASRPNTTPSTWSVEEWMRSQNIEVISGPNPYKGGRKWDVPCPFNSDHDGDAALFETPDGRPGFYCFHNSCNGNKWRQYREAVEPGCYDRRHEMPAQSEEQSAEPEPQRPAEVLPEGYELETLARDYIEALGDSEDCLISTGIAPLDDALSGGIDRGELVIVAARPSHGKSMFALQLAHHMSLHTRGVIISEEMSARALAKRAVQYISSTHSEHWHANKASIQAEIESHFDRRESLVVYESVRDLKRLQRVITHHRNERAIEFAIVDYLQLLAPPGRGRYEGVTEVSVLLKGITQETGVTVIALAQLSRAVENRCGKDQRGRDTTEGLKPRLSDLKESGQLEQDADVVLGLIWPHRHDSNRSYRDYILYLLKNRNRETCSPAVYLEFEPNRQRLRVPQNNDPYEGQRVNVDDV